MLKLVQGWDDFSARVYWAHDFAELMDLGGRLSYKVDDLSFGAAILWEDFEHDNALLHYEFDIQYKLLELIDISTQFSIIDDGMDETDDQRAFIFANYSKEFHAPVLGKLKPYIGVDTFFNFEEKITFIGLNCEPITNGYVKFEFQQSTTKDIEDILNIQVVYVF
jgi:hypothetical protein